MKARKLNSRNKLAPLPMPDGFVEVEGDFEVQYGDQVYILPHNSKTWVYYATAYGWAGNNSIKLALDIYGKVEAVRYARLK